MITASARALLTSLVDECISQRLMFTVYSLTQAVRHTNEYLKHDDSRRIVHKMYDDGDMSIDYTRTLVDLGGAGGPCFVYHHRFDDPTGYTDQVILALPAAQANACQALLHTASRSGAQRPAANAVKNVLRRSQTERIAGSRQRISLPNTVVRGAGFVTGDLVYVGYDAQGRTYTYERQMPLPGRYDRVGLTRVDKSNNIRHRVGQSAALRFRISVTPLGCIRAEPVTNVRPQPSPLPQAP